jgi:thymidylate kinase
LDQAGRVVAVRHLRPQIVMPKRGAGVTIVVDPHGKPPRSPLTSVVKIFVWLIEEWYSHLFHDERKTLLICDRYYHDLLIDPRRYRYGGPMGAARVIGKLMPRPDLWILLDAAADVLQARKQEVPQQETERQRSAYLDFVQCQKNHAVVDAAQPLDNVIANVELILTEALIEYEGDRK